MTAEPVGSSGTREGVPDDLALPRPPGALRRFLHGHPWITDSLVALAYLLFAAVFIVVAAVAPGSPPLAAVVGLSLAGSITVLLRRRLPVVGFAVANLLLVAGSAAGTTSEVLLPLLTIYAVGVYRSTRAAWVCFGAGSLVAALSSLVGATGAHLSLGDTLLPDGDDLRLALNGAVAGILLLLVATLMGTNVGASKRYVAALVDRAAQLARERDAQAEIARALERERIAREMHDVIAHSLSVMIALSEGARSAAPEHPGRAQDAMARAAETGRRTLGEVRRMLGAVREEGAAARAPQPALDDLRELLADVERAGLPVTLTTRGAPHVDPALELTLYRVVQESLTNTLRHASGATRAHVRLDWGSAEVTITVTDDGTGTPGPPPSAGRGLIGMRERVALFGGELSVGAGPARGWRVVARIPLDRSSS